MSKVKMSFTIKHEDLNLNKLEGDELQRYLMERKRGCGRHKSKKDYSRHGKHKRRLY